MSISIREVFHFNPSRKYLEDFIQRASQQAVPNAMVLDAGSGEGYYRIFFSSQRYHSTDRCEVQKNYGKITYVSDLTFIPVPNCTYDMVICTQVLEHLPNPGLALSEIFRVLKPTGTLWFSAPFFFSEHEIPFDFYRYTQYGLSHLLTSSGFSIEGIERLEGYYASLAYQCRTAAQSLPIISFEYGSPFLCFLMIVPNLFIKVISYLLSIFFSAIDPKIRINDKGICKNYCGVAKKPPL